MSNSKHDLYRVGTIITNNKYGPFRIVEDLGIQSRNRYLLVEFLKPNKFGFHTRVKTRGQAIKRDGQSNVVDPYAPTLYGVGCNGIVDKSAPNYAKIRALWENTIKNSYATYGPHYTNDVTVCLRWQCFEYFFQDVVRLNGFDLWVNDNSGNYVFNVDYENYSEFCPESCSFVPKSYNKSKYYIDKNKREQTLMGVVSNESTHAAVVKKQYVGIYDDIYAAGNARNFYADMMYGLPPGYIPEEHRMNICEVNKHKVLPKVDKDGKRKMYKLYSDEPSKDPEYLEKIKKYL